MIGSITEAQQQLAELEQRRQQAVAQQVTPAAAPAAVPIATPAAGYGPVPAALKSAPADAAKRRKGKDRNRHDDGREHDRIGRDLRDDPLTQAHESAEAGEHAAKNFRDRGAELGPAEGVEPGHPQPEGFDRDYLEAGHAAASPQAEPARTNPNPLPSAMRGVPIPIALSSQTMAAVIPPSVAASLSMGSPSDR